MSRRLGWARRRWWVVVVATVLVGVLAGWVAGLRPATYTAEAVLAVPSGAGPADPGRANEANRLAETYAQLLPTDGGVLAAIAQELDTPVDEVERSLRVDNVAGTSVLEVTYESQDPDRAVAGARAFAAAVSGPAPASASVPPGLLIVARLPDDATSEAVSVDTARSVGALLGFVLGVAIAAAWERADRRVDDVSQLKRQLNCPGSVLEELSPVGAGGLLAHWQELSDRSPSRVALVACERAQRPSTLEVGERLVSLARGGGVTAVLRDGHQRDEWASDFAPVFARDEDGRARHAQHHLPRLEVLLLAGGAPGTREAGEVVADAADLVVIVAPAGTPAATVDAAGEALRQYGITPRWVLFASRRPWRPVTAEPHRPLALPASSVAEASAAPNRGATNERTEEAAARPERGAP